LKLVNGIFDFTAFRTRISKKRRDFFAKFLEKPRKNEIFKKMLINIEKLLEIFTKMV